MKCDHCGHENPEGRTRCEGCRRPLQNDASENASQEKERETTRQQRKDVDGKLKKTINENEFKRKREQLNETLPEGKDMCPDCHLQLEDGVCPSCGYKINNDENKQEKENNMKNGNVNTKTVRFDPKEGKEEGRFALTPISGKTREAEGDPIPFKGTGVELSRSNTDPENMTITSKVQAVVGYEDGKWSIVDKSELKSTFVQAAQKIELQDGDVLLLGNQYYRFNNLSE